MNTNRKTPPTHLYIIGNGFDIHHGIKSRYSDYLTWLEDNEPELLNDIYEAFYECNSDWWNDFENNLSTYDWYGKAQEYADENRPNLLDDHVDRQWNDAATYLEQDTDALRANIQDSFERWINDLNKPSECSRLCISAIADSVFLNFNYTRTLEEFYNISSYDILHIHGCVGENTSKYRTDKSGCRIDNYIIGHGCSAEEIGKSRAEIQDRLVHDYSDEENEEFYSDRYEIELHEQLAIESAISAVASWKKPIQNLIERNKDFFSMLKSIKHVHIWGYSFSMVDAPYIDEIMKQINPSNVCFEISYYSKEDNCVANEFVSKYSIKNYSLIKLEEIQDTRQLRLF